MKANNIFCIATIATAAFVVGCAQDGTITTGSLNSAPDPACAKLAAEIKSLQDQGVPKKVAMAAKKKHKLNSSDLAKAAELNKANADFQARCSNLPMTPNVAAAPSGANKNGAAATKKKLAATKPPIPLHKPSTASLGANTTSHQAKDKPAEAVQSAVPAGAAAILPTTQEKPTPPQATPQVGNAVITPLAEENPASVQPTITQEKPTSPQATPQVGNAAPLGEEKPAGVQPSIDTGSVSVSQPATSAEPVAAQQPQPPAVTVGVPPAQ